MDKLKYIFLLLMFLFGFIYEQTGQALSLFIISLILLVAVSILDDKYEIVRDKDD